MSFGADDDENAYELYLKSKHILAEGGLTSKSLSQTQQICTKG